MGGNPEQLVRHLRRPIGVEHNGEAARARRHADRPHEFGKAVVGDHGVGACHQARRVGGRRGGEPRIAVSHDHAIAVRVDEDRGERRGHAGKALAAGAVDLFARECGQHPIAVRILSGRTAERASQRRASAKPRHRDRGVGGATAIDDEKTLRLGFCVRLREAIDPEHLVEHDDARAQDRARVVTRASGTQPLPPPRRG